MTVVKVVEHLGDGGGRKEIGLNPGGVGGVARFVVVDNGTFAFVIAMLRNVACVGWEVAARRIPPRQGVAFIKHTLGWPHPSGCTTGEKPPVNKKFEFSRLKTQKMSHSTLRAKRATFTF